MSVKILFKAVVLTNCDDYLQVKNFGPSPLNKVDLEFKIPISYAGVKNFIEINEIKVRMFVDVSTGIRILVGTVHESPLHLSILRYRHLLWR
jgi:hypothetical protein